METQNLWKKHLGVVPDEIWDRSSLRVLILADNELAEISSKIGNLQNLCTLDLGHNQLLKIPEELGDIRKLRDFLYLHDNRLESLPASLDQLQNLRYLNISENRFAALLDACARWQAWSNCVQRIINCRICRIALGTCQPCGSCTCETMAFIRLPPAIAKLSELRQIDLRGNPIELLPDALLSLPKLEKLDLRWVNTLSPPAWFNTLAGTWLSHIPIRFFVPPRETLSSAGFS